MHTSSIKFNLLLSESDLNSFCSDWIEPCLSRHFNLIWDHQKYTHSNDNTLIVRGLYPKNNWYQKYIDQGYKVINDDLWDQYVDNSYSVIENNMLKIRNKNWIWYNESLWWQHLGYHNYQQNKNPIKHFLLLMNQQRPHRDSLFKNLQDYLNKSIYSYIAQGVQIEDDLEITHGDWQRHMSPRWFDETAFSIVAESMMSPSHAPTDNLGEVFISEKTFKPIAFKHPFIIAGTCGLLSYLKEQGFATYDHVIDESYDIINDQNVRLQKVIDEIKRLILDEETFSDSLTLEKQLHNFNLFYNRDYIIQQLENTLIKDILDYAET